MRMTGILTTQQYFIIPKQDMLQNKHLTPQAVLTFLLILALSLRIFNLGNVPHGLHADEASYMLNAILIGDTLRDEDNRLLPFSLNSLTDPKPALYAYMQIPFIKLLGPSIAASRLPSVFAGIISIYLAWFLARQLGGTKLAMGIALFLTVSPWHIMISRSTQEVITSFCFSLASWSMGIKFYHAQRRKYLAGFFLFSMLAMYMYHATKIILPAFCLMLLIGVWLRNRQRFRLLLKLCVIVCLAFFISLKLLPSSNRFEAINVFDAPQPLADITQQIYAATEILPEWLLRVWYNKPHFFMRSIIATYFEHLSPTFLFVEWLEPRRYQVPFHGLLYIVDFPFLLLGLYTAISKRKREAVVLLLLWMLAPLPAAFTTHETPSTIRTVIMLLPLAYFISHGWIAAIHASDKRWVRVLIVSISFLAYGYSTGYFLTQLGVQQKVYQPWYRNWPYSRIANEVKQLVPSYARVYVGSDLRPLYSYFALNGLIDPQKLQIQPTARFNRSYTIEQFTFSQANCLGGLPLEDGVMYVLESSCLNEELKSQISLLKRITYYDGVEAYVLVTKSLQNEI